MQNIKTLKDFLKLKTGKSLDLTYPIKLFDEDGNRIYYENSSGFWCKYEFDEEGNETYFENSSGFCYKRKFDEKSNQTYYEDSNNYWSIQEFDEEGNQIYYENSNGYIDDKRSVKEMSVASIEKALGHKVKVIK